MALQILKKISVATLSNLTPSKLAALVPTPDSPLAFVGRIIGSFRSYEVGTSTYGDFFKFKGEIRAWDQAGQESASAVCFFPAPIDEMLKAQIDAAREAAGDGKQGAAVEVAVDILVAHDPKEGSKGYQYRVQTLAETKVSDPVQTLIASLPALPAPKADAPAVSAGKEGAAKTK